MSSKSKYPEQFRKDAVALASSSDRPLRQVARDLGVNHETLRNWIRTADLAQAGPVDTAAAVDQEELRESRERVAELKLEKDIQRKAAAYFALVPGW